MSESRERKSEPPPKIAPPPVVAQAAPAPVQKELDQHYAEFARENPEADPLGEAVPRKPSSS